MDYEYQISEGGMYTVKAFAPSDAATTTSNQVEVGNMNVSITDVTIENSTVTVSFDIESPVIGSRFYVTLSDNYNLGDDYPDNGRATYTVRSSSKTGSVTFNLHYNTVTKSLEFRSGSSGDFGNAGLTVTAYHGEGDMAEAYSQFASAGWTKGEPLQLEVGLTPYTNDLTITCNEMGDLALGVFGNVNVKFTPSGTYVIDVSSATDAWYNVPSFSTHVPANATMAAFSVDMDFVVDNLDAYFDLSALTQETTQEVYQLGTPVLTYSASTNKLQWNEVIGADRYEVWKDGAKVADVPKKT